MRGRVLLPMAPSVKVYSTPVCPNCVKAKDFLKSKGIGFEEINVAEDRASALMMIQMTGQRSVPVIQVGNSFIVGFDESALKEALHLW